MVPEKTELPSLLCVCTNNKIAELADRYTELKFTRSAPLPKAGTEEEQNFLLSCPRYSDPLDTPSSVLFVPLCLCWPFLSNRPFSYTQDKQLGKQMMLYPGLELPIRHGIFPWGCFVWAILRCKDLTGRKNWPYKVWMPC